LSGEGLEAMRSKIPKWETELWSYISCGNGMSCPLYNHCRIRERGGCCPSDEREHLNQLLDETQYNPHSFDFIRSECGCGGPGRVFQLVEMLAQQCLKLGKAHYPPVPTGLVKIFDQQHTIEIRQLPLKAYHGAIWRWKDRWVIQLKEGDSSATKRFTLFHEAFHILAHRRTTPVFSKVGSMVGRFNELLADEFATCILMPRECIEENWVKVRDLDRMAEIFDVPKSAICLRLRQLGLI